MRLATLVALLLGLASAGLLGVALGAFLADYKAQDWRPDENGWAAA